MRANSLVPILSEIFDFPFDTAQRIDRNLAEAGLRAKGKGRNLPDMSRRESLIFLIACMVTEKVTKAHEEVAPWLTARGKVNEAPSLKAERDWGMPDSESEDYQHYLAMETLLTPHKGDNGQVNLIDYLSAICELIQSKKLRSELVQLEIDFSDSSATVQLVDEDGSVESGYEFLMIDPLSEMPFEIEPRSTGIKRKCTIKGTAFREIINRT